VTTGPPSAWHLAQLNIGRLRAPIDSPVVADFVNAIAAVNDAAERSPRFVWRLQSNSGNATDIQLFDDPQTIVNLTVWESIEALHSFTYSRIGMHAPVLARRREWFEHMDQAYLVLWWVPAGHIPTTQEALARLGHLRAEGPSPHAFTFKQPFAPPEAEPAAARTHL
jgi:hypothetical protein